MKVSTSTSVSITEANQNFSKVARLVDEIRNLTAYGRSIGLTGTPPVFCCLSPGKLFDIF